MNIKKQIAKMYFLDFLGSFNLTDSIWLLLLVNRGFTLWEAGLAEGVFHLVSFMCEIPSGMIADLYGRRKALCISWLVFASASFLMLFSSNILGVCLAFGLNALGYNLASGTREALVFDSLKQTGEENRYISISSWQNVIWRSSATISKLMAGVALLLGFKICYIIHIVTSLCGFCIALTLTDADSGNTISKNISLQKIARDLAMQAKSIIEFLQKTPKARNYMLCTATVTGLVTMVGFFIQQHLFNIGAGGAASLGPLLFLVSIGGVAGARVAVKLYKLNFKKTFAICCGVTALGMFLCGFSFTLICVLGGFVMNMFDEVLCTVTEAKLNHMFPSKQRASLVSVFSMCISLSMIIVAPLLGILCSLFGIGTAFAMLSAIIILVLIFGTKQIN